MPSPGSPYEEDRLRRGPSVAATKVTHADGPADHLAVGYTLDFDINFSGYRLPSRAPVEASRSEDDIEGSFQRAWCEADFHRCLRQGQINGAWRCLSTAAELAVGARPGATEPRAFDPTPEHTEAQRRHLQRPRESRGLGGLRILRRLRQLENEPEDFRLRRGIKASLI